MTDNKNRKGKTLNNIDNFPQCQCCNNGRIDCEKLFLFFYVLKDLIKLSIFQAFTHRKKCCQEELTIKSYAA
jgi:hypothetical protein